LFHSSNISYRAGAEAKDGFEKIICLGDELHIGIFDAIVHHLDVMAGSFRSDEGAAGLAVDLAAIFVTIGFNTGVALGIAPWHHAGAFERAHLAAGHSHA
jgi:hypothetical protein